MTKPLLLITKKFLKNYQLVHLFMMLLLWKTHLNYAKMSLDKFIWIANLEHLYLPILLYFSDIKTFRKILMLLLIKEALGMNMSTIGDGLVIIYQNKNLLLAQ